MNFNPPASRAYAAYMEPIARQYLFTPSAPAYAVSLLQDSDKNSNTYPIATSYAREQIDAARDPLEHFFLGKKVTLSRSVEDIVGLIDERVALKYTNIRTIDYESCETKTKIFELDRWYLGMNSSIDKMRSAFERELLGFEREKRMEEVACWRDVARLKSELREATKELDQENRRGELLK